MQVPKDEIVSPSWNSYGLLETLLSFLATNLRNIVLLALVSFQAHKYHMAAFKF